MKLTKIELFGVAIGALIAAQPAAAQEQRKEYHLEEQSLGDALRAVGRQSGREIMFLSEAVEGKRSPRLEGIYTPEEAVERLLSRSGLVAIDRRGSILIRGRSDAAQAAVIDGLAEGHDIVVTGSRIRGAPSTSPVSTITREDARRAGQTDLGQLIRDLPQNFAGGQSPTIAGPGQGGTQNTTGSSAINLRGLGPDASLTLINGHRQAYDAIYQGVDISAIPLAAIERIDIAADGASALYGSDAVGGVANVILRRRVDGIVTSARLGAATDGGAMTQQYTVVVGPSWKTGSIMAAADYRDTTEIAGRQRSYTSKLSPDATMIGGMEQIGLVLAGQQKITDDLQFEVDGNYLHRSVPQCFTATAVAPVSCYTSGAAISATVDSWSVSPSLDLKLASVWDVRLGGTYSASNTTITTRNFAGGVLTTVALPRYDNTFKSVELGVEGPLFSLPGGVARIAFGAGYRSNTLDHDLRRITGGVETPVLVFNETRDVTFAYGELFLPLISTDNGIGLVSKLQLVAALRYEDHHDVDRVTTPKVGLVYSPVDGLELKASWGKSFKAPTLYQLGQSSSAQLVPAAIFSPAPPNALPVLYLFGGNPNLTPERATTWNISAAITPAWLEGFRAEISYFRIKYRERVATPAANVTGGFLPAYSDLVQLNPSAQDVLSAVGGITGVFTNLTPTPFNPGAVSAIFSNFFQNVSLQSTEGVDLSLSYSHDFSDAGRLFIKSSATYIDSDRRITATLPISPQAGVVFTPPHWRGRAVVNWDRGNISLAAIGNYVGGTDDNRFVPVTRISSFTSFDTLLTVRSGKRAGIFSNIDWQVGIQNLFNKKPALIRTSSPALPPYDSLNQSPMGRVVNLTLTKVW